MESLGEFLKDKRIKSNKSLEDIAQETKIRKGLLEAIENDQHELFPPKTYLRGLLRTYAKEVGIDPEEVLDKYEAMTARATESSASIKARGNNRSRLRLRFYVPVCLILFIIFLVYFIVVNRSLKDVLSPPSILLSNQPQEQASTTVLPRASTTVEQLVVPAPEVTSSVVTSVITAVTSTTTTAQETTSSKPGTFTIRFEGNALTWIRIKADEEKNVDILLSPGQSYKHSASQTMRVRLGNAGGVSIFYNDTPLGSPGKAGQIVDLEFPADATRMQREKENSTPEPQN
jgi:transcriptional regulator with XRE-family HTH domain